MDIKVIHAIENNIDWCSRIWQSHSLTVLDNQEQCYCTETVPDFYPNIITRNRNSTKSINNLLDNWPTGSKSRISVKDSWSDLDLLAASMEKLFSAYWLFRKSSEKKSPLKTAIWQQVQTASELSDWEKSWDNRPQATQPIFLPNLLKDPTIQFWISTDLHTDPAGYIANSTGPVTGISNIFGDFESCISHATHHYPDRDLVTYESGQDYEKALDLKFETIGELTIWMASPS